jgi:Zn-dependent protease
VGSGSLQLARVAGIRIGVHASWFLILFAFIFIFSGRFEEELAGDETRAYVGAVIAAVLFFGSILLHELGHALAARREGIEVSGIELFLFGGLMTMSRDTDSPGAEFKVAVAGPLVTVLIIALGSLAAMALAGPGEFVDTAVGDGSVVGLGELLVSVVVTMNIFLLVFNLVPAFPLDGGRIARAVAWKLTGSRSTATRFSARLGQGFAALLIGGGLYLALVGDVLNGLWIAALGLMLGQAARGAVMQSAITDRLEGVTVADVMDSDPVTMPAGLPVMDAHDHYFGRYHGWDWFAVVEDDGRYVGLAHRKAVERAALQDGEPDRAVRELVAAGDGRVGADTPLEAVLASEPLRRLGALMAVDADGRLRGVITFEQVTRALHAHLAPS